MSLWSIKGTRGPDKESSAQVLIQKTESFRYRAAGRLRVRQKEAEKTKGGREKHAGTVGLCAVWYTNRPTIGCNM